MKEVVEVSDSESIVNNEIKQCSLALNLLKEYKLTKIPIKSKTKLLTALRFIDETDTIVSVYGKHLKNDSKAKTIFAYHIIKVYGLNIKDKQKEKNDERLL